MSQLTFLLLDSLAEIILEGLLALSRHAEIREVDLGQVPVEPSFVRDRGELIQPDVPLLHRLLLLIILLVPLARLILQMVLLTRLETIRVAGM